MWRGRWRRESGAGGERSSKRKMLQGEERERGRRRR